MPIPSDRKSDGSGCCRPRSPGLRWRTRTSCRRHRGSARDRVRAGRPTAREPWPRSLLTAPRTGRPCCAGNQPRRSRRRRAPRSLRTRARSAPGTAQACASNSRSVPGDARLDPPRPRVRHRIRGRAGLRVRLRCHAFASSVNRSIPAGGTSSQWIGDEGRARVRFGPGPRPRAWHRPYPVAGAGPSLLARGRRARFGARGPTRPW
jgi:hypothetical protein